MRGAYLSMKPLQQSLPNPVPHGIRRDLEKILESLFSQEIRIALVGPKIRQQPKKGGPSTPTTDLVRPLHLESEAIR